MNGPKRSLRRIRVLAVIVYALSVVVAFRDVISASSLPVLPGVDKQGVFTISDNVNLVLLDVSVKRPNAATSRDYKKRTSEFSRMGGGARLRISQIQTLP